MHALELYSKLCGVACAACLFSRAAAAAAQRTLCTNLVGLSGRFSFLFLARGRLRLGVYCVGVCNVCLCALGPWLHVRVGTWLEVCSVRCFTVASIVISRTVLQMLHWPKRSVWLLQVSEQVQSGTRIELACNAHLGLRVGDVYGQRAAGSCQSRFSGDTQ